MASSAIHAPIPKGVAADRIDTTIDGYLAYFGETEESIEARRREYADVVNRYYDLATDFYLFGWGRSFHFAPRAADETHPASIMRHEHFLALRLGLGPGKLCADIGCGVGGPARTIGRFSGANVVGINNNEYQLSLARSSIALARLDSTVSFQRADFCHLPFPDNHLDAAYQIEATCHAPDLAAPLREIFRALKPGGMFASYEWAMTAAYDRTNPTHVGIRKKIELGNALPPIRTCAECLQVMREVGFEIVEEFDAAVHRPGEYAWYRELDGGFDSLTRMQRAPLGRKLLNRALSWGEWLRLVPQGTTKVSSMLSEGADGLVDGGKLGIFTPAYFVLCRKPIDGAPAAAAAASSKTRSK